MPELPELIHSPFFLILAAVGAIFIIIGIIKHAWRFLIWIVVIVALLRMYRSCASGLRDS